MSETRRNRCAGRRVRARHARRRPNAPRRRRCSAVDPAFAAKVRLWERRLGELHLMVEPVEPDGHLASHQGQDAGGAAGRGDQASGAGGRGTCAGRRSRDFGAASGSGPCCNAGPGRRRILRDRLRAAVGRAPDAEPHCPPHPGRAGAQPERCGTAVCVGAGADRGRDAGPAGRRGGRGGSGVGHRAAAHPLAGIRGADDADGLLAMAALLAAWRFVPERVPPALQPVALMRLVGVTIAPPPPPPRPQAPRNPSSTSKGDVAGILLRHPERM